MFFKEYKKQNGGIKNLYKEPVLWPWFLAERNWNLADIMWYIWMLGIHLQIWGKATDYMLVFCENR